MTTKPKTDATIDTDQLIANATMDGKKLITDGKTKIEAAMAIYRQLEHLPQETVVAAFIQGAGLTSKGALTYWYNCRRKLCAEKVK